MCRINKKYDVLIRFIVISMMGIANAGYGSVSEDGSKLNIDTALADHGISLEVELRKPIFSLQNQNNENLTFGMQTFNLSDKFAVTWAGSSTTRKATANSISEWDITGNYTDYSDLYLDEGMNSILGLTYRLTEGINIQTSVEQSIEYSTGVFTVIDKAEYFGFESVVKSKGDKIDWYASYSYLNATFEGDYQVLGLDQNKPENQLSIGGDFHFSNRISFGAEAVYNSEWMGSGNSRKASEVTDGYTVLNLRAVYSNQNNFAIITKVTNVLNSEVDDINPLSASTDEILEQLNNNNFHVIDTDSTRTAWVGLKYRF